MVCGKKGKHAITTPVPPVASLTSTNFWDLRRGEPSDLVFIFSPLKQDLPGAGRSEISSRRFPLQHFCPMAARACWRHVLLAKEGPSALVG